MPRNILYKLGLIVAVAAFSLFLAYPPEEQINLGLDLQGGIHLVLQVVVEEAVAGEVRSDFTSFRELLESEGIATAAANLDDDTTFTITLPRQLPPLRS